jgi:hypothetical protein
MDSARPIPEDFPQISGASNNRATQAYQKKYDVNRNGIPLDTERGEIFWESAIPPLLRRIRAW